MTLAETIKQSRERAGLTQQQVAERAKIRQSRVAELESGAQRNPKLDRLCAVARGLGVPVWKLLKGLES